MPRLATDPESAASPVPRAASYPLPPWRLRGPAAVVGLPVPLESARRFLSRPLAPVPVSPGWTLGGVLVARYGPGSTMEYSELIVFSSLARAGRHVGFWVSHIYVDLPASVAGGREIWGLPKELADFSWGDDGSVAVREGGRALLSARLPRSGRRARLPLVAPVWGSRGGEFLYSAGFGSLRGRLADVEIELPPESPLAEVGFGKPNIGVAGTIDIPLSAPRATVPA